jgi:hypothetical protein
MAVYSLETDLVTIDSAVPDEELLAPCDCMEVQIVENAGGATANLLIRRPFSTSDQINILAGLSFTFRNGNSGFTKGSRLGFAALVSGSAQFAIIPN